MDLVMSQKFDVAIIGAGLLGIASAFYLARSTPSCRIILIDAGDPLALTSAQSGNNYRNWWPQPTMVGFMNRSITLMERIAKETDNRIALTRRGYLLASRSADISAQHCQLTAVFGAAGGPAIRVHTTPDSAGYQPPVFPDWKSAPDGFDFLTDQQAIRQHFPSLSHEVRSVLHVRRAGDVSGQQLGQFMLEDCRARGVRFQRGTVQGIDSGRHYDLAVETAEGTIKVGAERILNAAGPFASHIASLVGVSLPLANVPQQKVAFPDPAGAIPRDLPFTIDIDPQHIDWTDEERDLLLSDPDSARFASRMPGAIHCRPEGGDHGNWVKLGWAYNSYAAPACRSLNLDPRFPEIVLRGAARLHPALKVYYGKLPRQMVHYGGFYTKTSDNWPLIGPMGAPDAFMVCGLSGHGTMAACASGELAASWLNGCPLPEWAGHFLLDRFEKAEPRVLGEEGLL